MHQLLTKIVGLPISCLGVVSGQFEGFFKDLGVLDLLGEVQASAVIGTALSLHKTLSL